MLSLAQVEQSEQVREPAGKAPPPWRRFKDECAGPTRILQAMGEVTPPVDVEKIALGLGIVLGDLDSSRNYSGAVQVKDGQAYVWVQFADPPVRRRFTIAHEIGHLMLHDVTSAHRDYMFRDYMFSGSAMEQEANRFAAELLMPDWMLRPMVWGHRRSVAELAWMFGVSEQAMKIRLRRLRLI